MTSVTTDAAETPIEHLVLKRRNVWGRLYHGETRMDFMGRKWLGLGISIAALVITAVSLIGQSLNLGLDFEGGVQWEVPSQNITEAEARDILTNAGADASDAKIVTVSASGVDRLRVQVGEQTLEVRQQVIDDLAAAANVDVAEISSTSVTSSWGREITDKAIRALIVFVVLVSAFIAWRFEWRMALGAIAAMVHDVLISVGVYSLLQLEVTPSTVIAFLTILGFSLYDTIVVYDKIDENTARFSGARMPYDDIINVSMNQVLMRSLNTNVAAVLPVLSLLVVGSGIMGAIALRDFALALFVGLMTGSYSSIFIAAPVLATLKVRTPKWRALRKVRRATGVDLERLVLGGSPAARRESLRNRATTTENDKSDRSDKKAEVLVPRAPATPDRLLTHPPRPRKKTRR
ncbi:MAG: protein translocase subunit SecF [Ilumatobacteraceae bacterium]